MTAHPPSNNLNGRSLPPCPSCGADNLVKRYSLGTQGLFQCPACRLVSVLPRSSSQHMLQKIQSWAEQDVCDEARLADAFAAPAQAFNQRLLHWLEKDHATNGRRLLDIGCATGAFLQAASQAGWQGHGIEIGHASCQYAVEKLGLAVRNMSLFDIPASEHGDYDAVICLEVIEHLADPAAALAKLGKLLRPGGTLLLSTPNYNSLIRRCGGTRWWVINCPDEHISLFTPFSLRYCLTQAGFQPERLRIIGFDLAGMARLLLSPRANQCAAGAPPIDYYQTRAHKARLKKYLRRVGLLGVAKGMRALFDQLSSRRFSPFYGLGERLIVVARKQP